ncbi:TRC40/GET3/ArsA family transport-energizing ATPase [Paraclostridium ghonii]|uniref:TRC40/GET3/ArsA family transport-energizing ATPase n=1 Tax=Paraclostridium ghonii TaxID=29358 RepID=UPI00202CAB41|nr:TRC40/GET3/ArsA family transport-energizing ATPase [Paeniclostridium ghonii]MCM0167266.1 TRC40/GET3/ArsA family transport-energizing ATPase [Paeniclostridium ghonii]
MTQFLFFSGKGGVGKTSMACTTGVYNADKGLKTLIVTTDPAANLSDVFEQEIGHKITKVNSMENLYAMEIDPDEATNEYKENLLAPMREIFDEEMIKIADEQLSGPCTEEMASFDRFIDFMEIDEYDIIIFDTAPTGHTIRLLELPIDWSKHIEESAQGSGQTCMGPVSMIQDSKDKFDRAIAKLRDTSQTDFIFVMQPEQTSLDETVRASNELKELGISTTKVIINGFIPQDEAITPFFKSRYEMQQNYLEKAKKIFKGWPIDTMELFDSELKGVDRFRVSASILFDDKKPVKTNKVEYKNIDDIKIQKNENAKSLILPKKGSIKNVFFSGKGGVGKTVMACITAVKSANEGFKTLLLTTDPAAHIGKVLDKQIKDNPAPIDGCPNLYAAKIDPKVAFEEYKEMVLKDAKSKFSGPTIATMEEELNSPCTEEMAAFQKFISYASEEEYDVIVFDTAPTGHTLRLLELPMDWSKQIQMKAGVSAEISEEDKKQKEKFDRVIATMKDKEKTTFSFVMYPEKTPIIEAYRASEELKTVGIETQMVISNLIIPEEQATSPFFRNRRNMQEKYLQEIKADFKGAKLVRVPMYDKEIKGIDMLIKIGDSIF